MVVAIFQLHAPVHWSPEEEQLCIKSDFKAKIHEIFFS